MICPHCHKRLRYAAWKWDVDRWISGVWHVSVDIVLWCRGHHNWIVVCRSCGEVVG